MNDQDELWTLIRDQAPLPDPPAWFAARTLARLRATKPQPLAWVRLPRWIWAGGVALVSISLITTWQIHVNHVHDQEVTFAALDLLSSGENPHNQEEEWFSSY